MLYDLSTTRYLAFELSNCCPLAAFHKKCPLHEQRNKPVALSSRIVESVLNEVRHLGFEGTVEFHTYNEPLVDPRLGLFIKQAAEYGFPTRLWTNGFGLSLQMAKELSWLGVTEFMISAYSQEEYDRLIMLRGQTNAAVEVVMRGLDDRLNCYTWPATQKPRPCPRNAPLDELIINCEGQIELCCLDWAHKHTLADLHTITLSNVVRSGDLHRVHRQLQSGERSLDLCMRCTW